MDEYEKKDMLIEIIKRRIRSGEIKAPKRIDLWNKNERYTERKREKKFR